jgi:outer membrane lipoprotein-sorting protein
MRKILFLNCLLLISLILLFSAGLLAETPEEKGLAIANAADVRDTGFENQIADMIMILRNRKGQESTRYIHTRTLEVEGDGDKFLSIFDKPADIKHTAVLTYSHGLKPDDQWLYLPALKRVKRINSRNKSGPFVGSEFAFEDLGSQEVEKYSYKYLRDESCGDWECYVIERYPEYEYSGYTRQVGWIDKAEYRVVKIDFYDRKDALLKTLTYSGYQEYIDYYWRPDEMFMQNHQTGKSTVLKWSNYKFKTAIAERDFNPNALSRLR